MLQHWLSGNCTINIKDDFSLSELKISNGRGQCIFGSLNNPAADLLIIDKREYLLFRKLKIKIKHKGIETIILSTHKYSYI